MELSRDKNDRYYEENDPEAKYHVFVNDMPVWRNVRNGNYFFFSHQSWVIAKTLA